MSGEAFTLRGLMKRAGSAASSTDMASASPVPIPAISPTPASGKTGPVGLAPRTNYTRVNTGEPPKIDAGSATQKSLPPRGAEMLPKLAGGEGLMNMHGRPTLNDLVKSAMAESAHRVNVSQEASFREGAKLASPQAPVAAPPAGDMAEKLASVLDYLAGEFDKEAADIPKGKVTSLPPGASASADPKPLPFNMGHSPTAPVKASPTEKKDPTRLPSNDKNPAGFHDHMRQNNSGSSPSHGSTPPIRSSGTNDALTKNTNANASMGARIKAKVAAQKQASDVDNPAHLHGPAAVPPDTSASGEPGKEPVAGPPRGPTNLIDSVANAINFNRREAREGRRGEMGQYLNEPMQAASHDRVLDVAFEHTNQAGPKIASVDVAALVKSKLAGAAAPKTAAPTAPAPTVAQSVKTAAARATLMNLAQAAEQAATTES